MGEVVKALAFMALGGLVVEVFEIHAWRRYQMGKRESYENYVKGRK